MFLATHVVTGARFSCTCYGISSLAFQHFDVSGVTFAWQPMSPQMHDLRVPVTESAILHSNTLVCLESVSLGNPCRHRCTVYVYMLRSQQSCMPTRSCVWTHVCLTTHSVTSARFSRTCYGISNIAFLRFDVSGVTFAWRFMSQHMHDLRAPVAESVFLHSNTFTFPEAQLSGRPCRNRCTICVHLLRHQLTTYVHVIWI